MVGKAVQTAPRRPVVAKEMDPWILFLFFLDIIPSRHGLASLVIRHLAPGVCQHQPQHDTSWSSHGNASFVK
jgi:hypothetical protein